MKFLESRDHSWRAIGASVITWLWLINRNIPRETSFKWNADIETELNFSEETVAVTWPQLTRDWRFSDHVTSADKRVQWASETSVDVGIELNFQKFLCLELEGRGEIC